jgi:hypothetical protein
MLRAYARPATSQFVAASGAAAAQLTGTVTETTLATITIPGGLMGPNGVARVTVLYTNSNSANNKTLRVKFGGTTYFGPAVTTNVTSQAMVMVRNRNATNSQVGMAFGSTSGFGGSSAAAVTSAVDTTADITLLITGQLANATDTLTLEGYTVDVLPA